MPTPPRPAPSASGAPDGHGAGARVAVVADDAAGLPPAWLERFRARPGFRLVHLPVLIDGQVQGEDGPRLRSDLVIALAEGRAVTTSRPAPGALARCYRELAEEGFEQIVSVHLSAQLSGTVGAARIARQEVEIPVQIVDTGTAGLGQGLGVRAAVQAAVRGEHGEHVAAAATRASAASYALLQVATLDTLRRGGRIGSTAAMLGSMLQLKPLVGLADGRLVVLERPLSQRAARARFTALVGRALAHSEAERPVLGIHHVSDPDGARELGETLVERFRPEAQLVLAEAPPVLTAHVGLGAKAAVVEGPVAVGADGLPEATAESPRAPDHSPG